MGLRNPLVELRLALEMTQTDFSYEVGVKQSYISQLESGERSMGRETALAIADRFRSHMNKLGITVEDLLRGRRRRGEAA